MLFGAVAPEAAEGAVLAHAVTADDLLLKKGRKLSAADIAALRHAGVTSVMVARLGPGDVDEDAAASALAAALLGSGLTLGDGFTGRVNLHARAAGLLLVDAMVIDRVNAVDEALTVATLAAHAPVSPGTMVATIKVIPFAASRASLDLAIEAATAGGRPALRLAPFAAKRVRMIQTRQPGTAAKVLDKTVRVTTDRLQALGSTLLGERRTPHDVDEVAAAIGEDLADCDILLMVGASAITDRRDVLPAAVKAAGGRIHHFGMPVDPGNLLLLAEAGGRPVLGLPGCARSPKLNGFDWVLQRLVADLPVTAADIRGMGVGGLLMEMPQRPEPRERRPPAARVASSGTHVGAILLAAGRGTRMGGPNKLLLPIDGRPMVRLAAEAVLASRAAELVVVTGHEPAAIEAALEGLPVRFAHNPGYQDGLAGSLRAGLEALHPDTAAALVCLADMPRVDAALIDRLIAAFDPAPGMGIVVPVRAGRRGNPTLWGRAWFDHLRRAEGDAGGRQLIAAQPQAVTTVEVEGTAALLDIDTPEAFAALTPLRAMEVEA